MKNEPTSARASRRSAGRQSAVNLALVILILLIVNYVGFKSLCPPGPLDLAVLHALAQDEGRAEKARCAAAHLHRAGQQGPGQLLGPDPGAAGGIPEDRRQECDAGQGRSGLRPRPRRRAAGRAPLHRHRQHHHLPIQGPQPDREARRPARHQPDDRPGRRLQGRAGIHRRDRQPGRGQGLEGLLHRRSRRAFHP